MWMPSLPARPVADPAAVKRAGAARTVTSSSSRSASLMSRAPACSIVAAGVTVTVLGTWSTRRSMRVELTVTSSSRATLPSVAAAFWADAMDGALAHTTLSASAVFVLLGIVLPKSDAGTGWRRLARAGGGGFLGFVGTHFPGGRHAAPPIALQAMRRAQPAQASQELGRWLSVPLPSDPSPPARLSSAGNWPCPNHWKWDFVHGQNNKRESLSTASGDFSMRPSRPSRQPALVFNRQPNRRGNVHLPAPMPAEAGHRRRVSPSCRHRAAGMPQRGRARFGQESDTAPEKPWRSRLWAASASSNAGVASASVAQPVRAIAISSSSRNRRSTWATPAAPALARPYSAGRPISTALAPSAMALSTSVPRRMPPSTSSARGPVALWATASATRGSTLAVPGLVSRVRPPWLDTIK